jgi:hypothetical protein
VPADVWKHHAADSVALVGLSWTQVLTAEPVVTIGARRKDRPSPRWYERLRRGCGFDLLAEIEWLTVGLGPAAGARDVDLVVSGRFTRDELEACLTGLLSTGFSSVALERAGRTTAMRYLARNYLFGWIDEHTLLFTARAEADRAWVEARLDGKDGGAAKSVALAPLRQRDREDRTLWVVAAPKRLGGEPYAPGVPAPEAMFGAIDFGEAIGGELTWRYASEAEATALTDTGQASLADARKDPTVKLLLGKSRVERKGREVRVVLGLDEATTAALLDMVISVLAAQLDEAL